MSSRNFFIIFSIFIVAGLSLYYLIDAGFYPIAIVNGKFISDRSFNQSFNSAQYYYSQAIKTYTAQANNNLQAVALELRRALLDKMVQDILVSQELEIKVGSQLPNLVATKLGNLKIDSQNFNQAVAAVYGLDFDQFKELVLVPQAKQEILQANFQSQNNSFVDWLKNTRHIAKVIILAPDLKWDGQNVAVR